MIKNSIFWFGLVILLFLTQSLCSFSFISSYDRAVLAAQKNDWKSAKEYYLQALVDHPADADILFELGVACSKTKEHDKADAYFKQAAALSRSDALKEKAYFNSANSLVEMKKLEEALQQYDNVLALNPTNEHADHNRKIVSALLEQEKNKDSDGNNKQAGDDNQQQEQQSESNDNNADNSDQKQDGSKDQQNDQQNDQQSDQQNDEQQQNQEKDQDDKNDQSSEQSNQQSPQSSEDMKNDQEQNKNSEEQKEDEDKKRGSPEQQTQEDAQWDSEKQDQQNKTAEQNEVEENARDQQAGAGAQTAEENAEQGQAGQPVEDDGVPGLENWAVKLLEDRDNEDAALNKKMIKAAVGKKETYAGRQNCW